MSYMGVQMARHKGNAGYIADCEDKAVTIRPSSTANFFVDSLDRADAGDPNSTSSDFVINKNCSLFNGFFHRIAMNEVVMDWGFPNVAQWWGNNFLTVLVDDGASPNGVVYTVTLPDQFLSALDALSALVTALNAAPGMTATWTIGSTGTRVGLGADQPFAVVWEQSASATTVPAGVKSTYYAPNALARGLFASDQLYKGSLPLATTDPAFSVVKYVVSPLILGTRYVDFVSPQLTYNQDLKDNTTATVVRDALYRWYFAWDTQSGTDILPGSPPLYPYYILQGYKPFNQRRILPYPKQIRWESTQPIGQVAFQVFDDRGRLLDTSQFTPKANFQFQMSMLLSEN